MADCSLTVDRLVYNSKLTEIASFGNNSPWLAIAAARYDKIAQKNASNLFLHNADTYQTIQMTRNPPGKSVSNPTFISMKNGIGEVDHVLFLREGKIWSLPLNGGEASIVWEEMLPIGSFQVCGNNEKYIIAEINVPPHAEEPFAEEQSSGRGKGIMFEKLMIRYWTEWNLFKNRNHLFIGHLTINEDDCIKVEKPVVDLMHGIESDCPAQPPSGFGVHDYTVSEDGRWIAISCRKFHDCGAQPTETAWSTDAPIYVADLTSVDLTIPPGKEGYMKLKWTQVSESNLHSYHGHPVFPTGRNDKIAFLSMKEPKYESDKLRIKIYDMNTKSVVNLSEDIDLSFQSLLWSEEDNGKVIYANAQYQGSIRIFRLTVNETFDKIVSIQVLKGDESRVNANLVRTTHGDLFLYFMESTLLYPNTVKRVRIGDENTFDNFTNKDINTMEEDTEVVLLDAESIFDVNPEYVNGDLLMPTVQQYYFKGWNDQKVHAWYLPPLLRGQDEQFTVDPKLEASNASIPLLVVIHGGPQSAFLNNWNYRWNLATFASQGYGVIAINYHGSTGFGMEYLNSIRKDWGGKPYEDIMKGVDFILSKYSYLNPNRVAALGASYGGYMMNWLNGHTDRFRCLVNHAGIFSLKSEFFTTEELYFPGMLCFNHLIFRH
jgi:hypothetical protein